jgi:hypothetical protein
MQQQYCFVSILVSRVLLLVGAVMEAKAQVVATVMVARNK